MSTLDELPDTLTKFVARNRHQNVDRNVGHLPKPIIEVGQDPRRMSSDRARAVWHKATSRIGCVRKKRILYDDDRARLAAKAAAGRRRPDLATVQPCNIPTIQVLKYGVGHGLCERHRLDRSSASSARSHSHSHDFRACSEIPASSYPAARRSSAAALSRGGPRGAWRRVRHRSSVVRLPIGRVPHSYRYM